MAGSLRYFVRFFTSSDQPITTGNGGQWIELSDVSFSLVNGQVPGSPQATDAQPLSLSFGVDPASVALLSQLNNGQLLDHVEIEAYDPTGTLLQDEYVFSSAVVTNETVANAGSLTTTLSLGYIALQDSHVPYSQTGKAGTPVQSAWNFAKDAAVATTAVSADYAAATTPASGEPAVTNSFVRFYDSTGQVITLSGSLSWLRLADFSLGASSQFSLSPAGGSSVSPASADPLTLSFAPDLPLLALQAAALAGQTIGKVEIETYSTIAGRKSQVSEYDLGGATITDMLSDTTGTQMALTFTSLQSAVIPYSGSGKAGTPVATAWDYATRSADTPQTVTAGATAPPIFVTPSVYYVRFTDLNGQMIDSATGADWITLSGMTFDVGPRYGTLSLDLGSAGQTPAMLFDMLHSGAFRTVEIEAYGDDAGTLAMTDEYIFTNVTAEHYALSIAPGSEQTLTLDWNSYQQTHLDYSGKAVATTQTGWNAVTQSQPTLVAANPEAATAATPADGTPMESLTYYVRFFDANGTAILAAGSSQWLQASDLGFTIDTNGQPAPDQAHITFGADPSALDLFALLTQGATLDHIEVEAYGANQTLVDEYEFRNVILTGESFTRAETAAQTVDFTYGIIQDSHLSYGSDGKALPAQQSAWNFATDTSVTPAPVGADYLNASIPAQAEPDGLTFYVRFTDSHAHVLTTSDGSGWMRLDSLSFSASAYANINGGASAAQASALTLMLDSSPTAEQLDALMLSGGYLSSIEIEAYTAGANPKLAEDDRFSAVTLAQDTLVDGGRTYTLDYTSVLANETVWSASGTAVGNRQSGWNFTTHTAVTGPVPTADAPATVAPEVEATEYFVRVFQSSVSGPPIATDDGTGWVTAGGLAYALSATGRPDAGALTLTTGTDRSLVAMFSDINTGTTLARIEVEAYTIGADGQPHMVDEYLFDTAVVNGIDLDSASDTGQSVTFQFNRMQAAHRSLDATDQVESVTSTAWDFTTETAATPVAVTADRFPDAACFLRGTAIRTPAGEVPIEALAIGQAVTTASGAVRPVKWIGRRAYPASLVAANPDLWPVRIAPGALGPGVPARTLSVSADHALLLGGALVCARGLVNGTSITSADPGMEVEYLHVELDSHDVILAEGAPAETFIDCGGRVMFHNAASFHALYPQADPNTWRFCAPRLRDDDPAVAALRRRLAATPPAAGAPRGRLLGHLDRCDHTGLAGWVAEDGTPGRRVRLEILCNSEVLGEILADRYRADLAQAGIGDGCHGFSFDFSPPLSPFRTLAILLRRHEDHTVLPGCPRTLAASPRFDAAAQDGLAGMLVATAIAERDPAALDVAIAGLAEGLATLQRARTRLPAERRGSGPSALVIGASGADPAALDTLRRWGFDTMVAAMHRPDTGTCAAIERAGARLLGRPAHDSVETVLRRLGETLDLVLTEGIGMTLAYGTLVRRHCPAAYLIGRIDAWDAAPPSDPARAQTQALLAAWAADAVVTDCQATADRLDAALPAVARHRSLAQALQPALRRHAARYPAALRQPA